MDAPVKVLIVDDSVVARGVIAKILRSNPEISVVGFCQDGSEVVAAIERLGPDVITLDVEMPHLKGTTILKHVLSKCPIPVIMVSSMTREGAQITLDCLALGALDFVLKPGLQPHTRTLSDYAEELLIKVYEAGHAFRSKRIRQNLSDSNARISAAQTRLRKAPAASSTLAPRSQAILAIGASTGGPSAVTSILEKLPAHSPPIVIAIHMPTSFTTLYTNRLSRSVKAIRVKLAEHGEVLCPGTAYIAPGGCHFQVHRRESLNVYVKLDKPLPSDLYRPSIDKLFSSVALAFGDASLACVLTGMGRDGANGTADIFTSGGYVLSQDEPSCAIYGMPKVVFENGHSHRQISLQDFPQEIIHTLSQRFSS